MADWRPQLYRALGKSQGIDASILEAAIAIGSGIIAVNPSLTPIFTLRHLAQLTGTDYGLLRMIVSRRIEDPYRVFRIKKRPSSTGEKRFRVICAPEPSLLLVQRWLSQNVLKYAKSKVHPASTAYAEGCTLVDAASPHCGCRWLIKLDIKSFFESVTEISAYRAFRSLGYQPLIAFELARLSTRLGSGTVRQMQHRWRRHHPSRHWVIAPYINRLIGHLPQGAPTSPMLANMAMMDADNLLSRWAGKHGLTYTRYADDLTFSTSDKTFDRVKATEVVRGVYKIVARFGLSPNTSKTQIVPPRARKVVLGLLVDKAAPRLTREFKEGLRMHLHYLLDPKFGPSQHAAKRGFTAVAGLRNHLEGLVAYACQIEPAYGARVASELESVVWPI